MHSLTVHLVACLSAALTTFAQTTGVDVFVSTATVFPPPEANTTTLNGTIFYTCPLAPTVFVNFTEYVPVIETTTQPLTVYQTIISTTVLTSVQLVTETTTEISITTATTVSATTATETATVTTPITDTLTATELQLLATTTQRVTSVTLCPTRITNPAFTALSSFPTDWTWGCPPGWLCKPTRDECNWEFGLPDQNFVCSPNHCVPAEALPPTLPTWDESPLGNSTPAMDPGLTVQAVDSYFMMAPGDFGLGYGIFVVDQVLTLTSTTLLLPSPTIDARQAQTSVPGACYPWCNNCLLEAQANGKNPSLCVPGSAFVTSLQQCEECIDARDTEDNAGFIQIAPQFQQFLDYCDTFSTIVVTSSMTTTTTDGSGSTISTILSTTSATVTPTGATSAPPPPPPPPVTTVVTTSFSESTILGNDWAQVTIILPLDDNSTTTIYGSSLTEGATLVLPIAQTTQTYETTLTGPSSTLGASRTSTAGPSEFTGGAMSCRDWSHTAIWRNGMIVLATSLSLLWGI